MKKLILTCLIMSWTTFAMTQTASINNSIEEILISNSTNTKVIPDPSFEIDPERSWPITCFEGYDLWIYFDEATNEGYFTFYDPITEKANNDVFDGKEDYFFTINLGLADQGNFFYHDQSNLKVGSFIDPAGGLPYLFKFVDNGSNFENYDYANIHIIGSEYTVPCEPIGTLCSTSMNPSLNNYNFFTTLPADFIEVDFSSQPCEPMPEMVCDFEYNLVAEEIGDDVRLNTSNIDAQGLINQLDENEISKIQFIITGVKDDNSESQIIDFYNEDYPPFDPITWDAVLEGFASYNEFFYQILIYDNQGSQIDCPLVVEVDFVNASLYCDIFTALNHTFENGNLTFSFDDPNNDNYLVLLLNDLGYTISQAETLIAYELTDADFNLSYSDGGPYIQLSKNESFYNGIDLESFEASFNIGEVSDFSGALQIEYYSTSGSKNSCLISPILMEEEEEDALIPELDCNSIPPDVGDLSTILKPQVEAGDYATINGFPMVILNINYGDNETGIFGEGIIPLPFKKKQLLVNFSNIQVNIDGEVINGQAVGKNGPEINTFPNFELPPLYIGGDICVPPPITGPLDSSGIDPVTGLDGYGFDPETGKHHLTGTQYDPDGYDKDGNHIDTGELWNEEGCSREGILYELDPETEEMVATDEKCDPTGGTPPELEDFINLWTPLLDDTLKMIFDDKAAELLEDKNEKSSECFALKQILLQKNDSISQPFPFGDNNRLINKGMSDYFVHEPTKLNEERFPLHENAEEKHIELYQCDVEMLAVEARHHTFLSYEDVLLIDIKNFIEEKISVLKNNEFDELQKPGKFNAWLLNAILEYISQEESEDFGYQDKIELESDSPSNLESSFYNALVSKTPGIVVNGNALDAMAFEYGQGFKTVMGYPREIVAETLRKYQLDSGAENIESLLPLNIDTSFNRFDISILISNVIFHPTSAAMDVAAVITDTENNQKIAFGGSNLVLGAGALAQESSKLMLLNEVGIRLNNAARLFLKADNGSTYIEWDCNGFAGVNIEGSIQFCREYILPLDASNLEVITDENVLYELSFKKSFDRFFDFSFEIEDAPPFELTTMKGYKWRFEAFGVDYTSSKIENLNLDIPNKYNSQYFNQQTGELDDLWKGFYAKNIELVIPKKFTPLSNNEYTVAVSNLIIDDTGLTAQVEVGEDPGVLPWDEGNVNGWQMSIESINLLILQNSLAGGGIGGRIGLPVLKDPLRYSGTFYGNSLLFSVKPDSVCNFSPLGVKVKIFNNSYIQAEFGEQGFLAKAHLNGELDFTGFNGGKANLILPHLKFEGLEMMNVLQEDGSKKLRFSPGYWGVVEDDANNSTGSSGAKPLLSAFGISIDRLSIHGNDSEDGLILNVRTSVSLLEESLKATGDIQLEGKLDLDEPVYKMEYVGMDLKGFSVHGEIKNLLKVDGSITWFDDTKTINKFGDGFRGEVGVQMLKLFPGTEITAACQFGKVDDHDYYFVDMVADFDLPLTLGPVTFNKFGGGMSKGMYPDYNTVNPQPDFLSLEDYAFSPLGTTISGIKYEPNPDYGHEFKVLTGFYMSDEDIFSGTGELLIRMADSGSLDEMEVRAQGQFLKAPDPYNFVDIATLNIPDVVTGIDNVLLMSLMVPKPDNDATLSGFASFRYNFIKREFAGKVAAYLNTPGGVIRGAGLNGALCMVDIYFGKEDWWIWVGEPRPGRRAGVLVDLVIVEASLQAYFDIGTKVPPFPGLPHRVAHLGRDLNITESGRASSHGFAFGASFDFLFDKSIAGTGVELAIGAGFDLMMRKYEDVYCKPPFSFLEPEELGMDGWYAMGQAWAYLDGSIKVFGFNIVSAGLAAVFQIQTPNPTWGIAALEIKYDTFLGSGTWEGDIEFGERCDFESLDSDDEFGMDLIIQMDPEQGQQSFGIDQSIAAYYLFPLAEAIPEFNFLDGVNGELSFEFDQDSFGIFNAHGPIPHDLIQDTHINSTIFKPIDFLSPNDSVWVIVKINILRDGQLYGSQSRVVSFRTSSELEVIHKSNIAYEYPIDGMTNFHTEQLASQQGYINLHRGQANIFYAKIYDENNNPIPYEIKARFTAASGYSFTEDLVYNPSTYTIKFFMPSDRFLPSTQYKLEIVRIIGLESNQTPNQGLGKSANKASDFDSQDKVFYTSYFRTSAYKTVTEKFNALLDNSYIKEQQNESTVRDQGDQNDYYLNYFTLNSGEVFDYYDIISNGFGEPLVNFIVAPNFYEDGLDLPGNRWAYYDNKGFWPQEYGFKVVHREAFKGMVKTFINTIQDYKVDVNSFDSNGFIPQTGALSYGVLSELPGKLSLRAEYNFPGHAKDLGADIVKMPLLELWILDFYNKVISLGSASDYTYGLNSEVEITEEVVNKIIELNNE